MKTLKCKNCGGEIEWEENRHQRSYGFEKPELTTGCPNCRQNIVYGYHEISDWIVDEPVVNDVEDEINKPSHYHKGGIDVMGYAEKQFSEEENRGFYRINAIKYLTRFDSKGQPLKDLKKARRFVDELIEMEEGRE